MMEFESVGGHIWHHLRRRRSAMFQRDPQVPGGWVRLFFFWSIFFYYFPLLLLLFGRVEGNEVRPMTRLLDVLVL